MNKSPNQLVKDYLDKHSISQKVLTSTLNTSQSNVSKLLSKDDMPISTLIKISEALNYNFFNDLIKEVPSLRNRISVVEEIQKPMTEIETAIIALVKKHFTL